MATHAIIKNGIYYCDYTRNGYADCRRENGHIEALGDDWEDFAAINPVEDMGFSLLPMEQPASKEYNKPVIVDGKVIWEITPDA